MFHSFTHATIYQVLPLCPSQVKHGVISVQTRSSSYPYRDHILGFFSPFFCTWQAFFWSAHFPPFICLASSSLTLGLSLFMKNLGGLPGNSHSHLPIGYSFFRKGTPGKHRLSLYTVACSGPRTLPGMYWAFNNYLSNTSDLPKYLPSYVFLLWHHELCVSSDQKLI